MAIVALHSAATGLSALTTALDVAANNLANANTEGFKASRVNFEDLLYIERAQPGVENTNGDRRPTGIYVGLGVKVSGTQVDFAQGAPIPTERPLDIMIDGQGFFEVQIDDELGEGLGYTRAGNFTVNNDGDIVLANGQGRVLQPEINVPTGTTNITISTDGIVSAAVAGTADPVEIGQIQLSVFVNPTGLKQIGENLYVPSAASGPAELGDPIEGGRGRIIQGHLEGSNVDPVKELVGLIRTQRAFELNSQSIQAADEALRTIGNLRRF
ncbi:MAG: flagellar basal-body rod protein FlgG [Planctomycetota bacterium]|jgi:flagellar basal-body rod protein FlgG